MPKQTVTGRMLASSTTDPDGMRRMNVARVSEVEWQKVFHTLQAGENVHGCCFVYFIGEEDGPLKIGYAKDPIQRLRQMQTGNPRPLKLERVLIGDRQLERYFHAAWKPFAIVSEVNKRKLTAPPGTEWFKADIREELFPIIETAKWKLENYIFQVHPVRTEVVDPDELVRLAREAHGEHGHVMRVPDEARFLASGGGYVSKRTERLSSS